VIPTRRVIRDKKKEEGSDGTYKIGLDVGKDKVVNLIYIFYHGFFIG
jgi:hypothetical protein